ncbi:MAG TPA: hypothetical protein PKD53_33025 [Chloroflexaceae bacterium]|nr:hypothetical protein [Chloroflexaceae bacterium]
MNRVSLARLAIPLLAALALAGLGAAAPRSAGAGQAAQAGENVVYLPAVSPGQPVATLAFATAVDLTTGEPVAPATRFAAGTDLIYVAARMQRFAGGSYRIAFSAPGGERLDGVGRPIPNNDYRVAPSYCFTTSTCEADRAPFPPGVYTVELLVGEDVVATGQFSVQ